MRVRGSGFQPGVLTTYMSTYLPASILISLRLCLSNSAKDQGLCLHMNKASPPSPVKERLGGSCLCDGFHSSWPLVLIDGRSP